MSVALSRGTGGFPIRTIITLLGGIVLGSRNPAFVEVKIPIRISEYQKILHAGWQLVLVKIC